ncbi:MAG TPA: PIG-L family deacetylase [Chloroflexia bacterium]|nr:PIG-L family deacetylase [Chloroflexia bacterium]
MTDLAILACYAHPDDEQGITGTLALCAEQGIRTALLCATRGELGEISDPALATPETLGAVREQELRNAAAIAHIAQVWFLDYRDSGMAGTDGNQDPHAFVNADPAEAIGAIVRVIREWKPQVIVTFDESGAYGHPDHIAICHWTTAAFHAAGDPGQFPDAGPAWSPARLFYSSIPRSGIRRMREFLGPENIQRSAFRDTDPEKMGMPDEMITHMVDAERMFDIKLASLRCHATQFTENAAFARIPPELMRAWRSKEPFALVAGTPVPPDSDKGDLFAGLR